MTFVRTAELSKRIPISVLKRPYREYDTGRLKKRVKKQQWEELKAKRADEGEKMRKERALAKAGKKKKHLGAKDGAGGQAAEAAGSEDAEEDGSGRKARQEAKRKKREARKEKGWHQHLVGDADDGASGADGPEPHSDGKASASVPSLSVSSRSSFPPSVEGHEERKKKGRKTASKAVEVGNSGRSDGEAGPGGISAERLAAFARLKGSKGSKAGDKRKRVA